MRTVLQVVLCIVLSSSFLVAQNTSVNKTTSTNSINQMEGARAKKVFHPSIPKQPLSPLVTVSGGTEIGVSGKWPIQTNKGGLHNIQVDPGNPQNLHAIIMQDLTVEDDTISSNYFLSRNIYYVFSNDGGATWSTPKALGTGRAGYPEMRMMQRGSVYVPVIAAHREDEGGEVMTVLYLENGAPGEGNFREVQSSLINYQEIPHEIIWPSLAISADGMKVYIIASTFRDATTDPYDYLQFGTYTLNAEKTDATWSGWQEGPEAGTDEALAYSGQYRIATSASGKIGVVWKNVDYSTGILAMLYSESNDGGSTWSNAKMFFEPIASPTDGSYEPRSGYELFFDGETPVSVFGSYATDLADPGSYYPASGSIWMWRGDWEFAKHLLNKNAENFRLDDYPAAIEMAELSDWNQSTGINPSGPNVDNPTVAVTADPKKFTIFFEAWIQDDVASHDNIPDDRYTMLPFSSIYKIWTMDGGNTWLGPEAVRSNNISAPQEEHLDYREPQVSHFNPDIGGGTQFHMLISVDSSAGIWQVGGYPNFSDVHFFFQKENFMGVKKTVAHGTSLEQSYPNPVVSGMRMTIPLSLETPEHLTVTITDVMGREIAQVYAGQLGAGVHTLPVATESLAAGMYQYLVKTAETTLARSFTVTK